MSGLVSMVKSVALAVICVTVFLLGFMIAMGGDPPTGGGRPEMLMSLLAGLAIFGSPVVLVLGFRRIWPSEQPALNSD